MPGREGRGAYDGGGTTGFASPAADSLEGPIDLAEILDLRRPHRYPVRVLGEALAERGILPGDILIADAAAPPVAGRVAIVMIHGEVLVAQLAYRGGQWWIRPARGDRPSLPSPGTSRCGRSSPPWCGRGCSGPRAVPRIFGLIDANSFYCSVEQAFDPRLRGAPVIVLSNNDGCAIARSAEAKGRGVRMGEPWHLVRDRPECADVVWLSSNYPLYGDMSRRMYEVLAERLPRVEPYSIDEMFLDLDVPAADLVAFCQGLRAAVRRLAKLPSCVGLGPTKTIAKLANALAKDRPGCEGVCDLRDPKVREALYRELPVGAVWGVGGRTVARLERLGVATVADLVRLPPWQVRGLLTVVGARVQAELRGVSCLPLALAPPTRKGLAVTRCFGRPVTRCFGRPVTGWAEMREAVCAHAARCGEKLRAHGLQARRMAVFLHTDPHADGPWYSAQRAARIEPTDDTLALIGEAVRLLRPLWREGLRYLKCGVLLDNLVPFGAQPRVLFPTRDPAKSARLMAALDAVSARHGRDALRPLAIGLEQGWRTRHARLSPRYTTRAEEMLTAQAW